MHNFTKTYLFVVCAAAAFSCTRPYGEIHTPDMDTYALNRPVRKIAVSCERNEMDYCVAFHKNGNIREIVTKNTDGTARGTTSYKYNPEGQLLETLHLNSEKEIECRYIYEYDSCFVSRRTLLGMNTNEIYRWDNTNDGKHITKCELYNEGELESVTEWVYGEDSREETAFDANGNCLGTAHYEYAADDRPTRIVSEAVDLDIEISYDEHMLPVWSRNVLINSDESFAYNDTVVQGDTIYYDYTFDNHDNWIRRVDRSSAEDEPFNRISRKIRY